MLPNGIKLSHCPLEWDKRLYVSAIFGVGTAYETPDKAGLAHFLEHMMFRGSKNFPDFLVLADAFERLGGEWNAATGHEATEYSYAGIVDTAPRVFDLFSEFLQKPLLLDIEKERKIIKREIEDELNEYGNSTDLAWQKGQLLWPASSHALPISGTQQSVNAIAMQDLWDFRKRHYRADNLAISVVGGKAGQVIPHLQKCFSSYPLSAESSPTLKHSKTDFNGPRLRWVANSDNQLHIVIGFLLAGEWSHDSHAYRLIDLLLSDGFSSLLSKRLREDLGLVYDVSTDLSQYRDYGSLDIHASVTAESINAFVVETSKILASLATTPASDSDFAKALNNAKVSAELFSSHIEELGFEIGWCRLCGKDPRLSTDLDKLRELTPRSLRKVASSIFTRKNCGIVVLGPPENEHLSEKILQSLALP